MSKPRDVLDPLWEQTNVVLVGPETLQKAEERIAACEACEPDEAELPFDCVLDGLTGCDPQTTEYVLPKVALCPRCYAAVKSGYFRWHLSENGERKLLVRPGTLVTLKNND